MKTSTQKLRHSPRRFDRKLLRIVCLSLLTVCSTTLHADEIGSGELAGVIKGVELKLEDLARDRCWTNPKTTANLIEAALNDVGIKVYREPVLPSPYTATVKLSVLAERDTVTNLCFGSRTLSINTYNFGHYILQNGDRLNTINEITVFTEHDVLLSSFNFNKLMRKFVAQKMAAFAQQRNTVLSESETVKKINSDYPKDSVLLSWGEFTQYQEAENESEIKRLFNVDNVYLNHLENNQF